VHAHCCNLFCDHRSCKNVHQRHSGSFSFHFFSPILQKEREENFSGMFGNVTITGKFELGGTPGNRFANGAFDHVIVLMQVSI
jgi:hypothetical protein